MGDLGIGEWGLRIADWGLGIGDWGLGIADVMGPATDELVVDLQPCTSTPFRIKWGIQCLVVPAQTEVCREYSSRGR